MVDLRGGRHQGSQGRVLAKTRGYTGFIRATPLFEGPQSAASRVIVCADPSSRIL
jgi:hypothetical protein